MMQLAIVGSDKPFIWLVQPEYLIGNGCECDIQLNDETPTRMRLRVQGDDVTLVGVEPEGAPGVSVNGEPADAGRALVHEDLLQLGHTRLQIVDPKKHRKAAPPQEAKPDVWRLHALSTALSDKHYDICGTVTLGRAATCDISLGVAHLSRQHARLTPGPKGLLVEDLASANGTFVNGARVERAMLKTGDELKLDTVRFRVFAPGAEEDADKTTLRPAMVQQAPRTKTKPAVRASSRAVTPRSVPVVPQAVTPQKPIASTNSVSTWWLFATVAVLVVAAGSYMALG